MSIISAETLINYFDEYMIQVINENDIKIPDELDEKWIDSFRNLYFYNFRMNNWVDERSDIAGKYKPVKDFFSEYLDEIDSEYLINLIDPIMLK